MVYQEPQHIHNPKTDQIGPTSKCNMHRKDCLCHNTYKIPWPAVERCCKYFGDALQRSAKTRELEWYHSRNALDSATMVWCANDAAWGGLSVLERLNPGNIRPWPCCQKLLTTVTKSNWAQEQPHWNSTAVLWTQRVDAPPPLHSNSCRARGVTIHPMLKCYFLGPKTPLDSADIRQHGPWNHATTWRSWSAPFKRHKAHHSTSTK
jgi:hypothetical protein